MKVLMRLGGMLKATRKEDMADVTWMHKDWLAQERFDNAHDRCMMGKGVEAAQAEDVIVKPL